MRTALVLLISVWPHLITAERLHAAKALALGEGEVDAALAEAASHSHQEDDSAHSLGRSGRRADSERVTGVAEAKVSVGKALADGEDHGAAEKESAEANVSVGKALADRKNHAAAERQSGVAEASVSAQMTLVDRDDHTAMEKGAGRTEADVSEHEALRDRAQAHKGRWGDAFDPDKIRANNQPLDTSVANKDSEECLYRSHRALKLGAKCKWNHHCCSLYCDAGYCQSKDRKPCVPGMTERHGDACPGGMKCTKSPSWNNKWLCIPW